MRILSWNVNGIRAADKKGFFDWFKKEKPDILCLQEIKAQPEQLPPYLRNTPGYNVYINSAERKGYSGVATYSKIYADNQKAEGKNIVVCGDFNTAHKEIDLARPKENEKTSGFLPIERAWIDTFIDHGYIDTFRYFNKEPGQYTWWDIKTRARERNVGWRIDYFFVNKEFIRHVKKAFIMPEVTGSDHCPIGIELDI